MQIAAVLFDLDNTLLLEDEATFGAVRAAAASAGRAGVDERALAEAVPRLAAELWAACPVIDYTRAMGIWWGEGLWGDFGGDVPELRAVRAFVGGFRDAVWGGALAAIGASDDALARALGAAYRVARRAHQPVDAEAEPVLAALSKDHRLALVTNGAPDVQREKLAGTTLARFFSTIVISCEVGIGKPDPRIFEIALERCGARAEDAVMVGDALARDVAGAHAAGLRSIWIDRRLWADDRGPRPDARIERLSELPAALGALARGGAWSRGSPTPRPA